MMHYLDRDTKKCVCPDGDKLVLMKGDGCSVIAREVTCPTCRELMPKFYKVVWDFTIPSFNRKKKAIRMKGEHTGGYHPMTKDAAERVAAECNRQYGEGTHRVEVDA